MAERGQIVLVAVALEPEGANEEGEPLV